MSLVTSQSVFIIALIVTFLLALLGRRHAIKRNEDDLAGKSLNKWLVGLSAGATANSGFIVTGAVGLGYLHGLQWMMLPLGWLIGDLVFWRYFPHKINEFGRENNSRTISELLSSGLSPNWKRVVTLVSSVIIIIGIGGYTSAQWLAGEKFIVGAFDLSKESAIGLFALLIISYSTIGGFRGSVYVDTFQAILRILSTLIILGFSINLLFESDFESAFNSVEKGYFIPFYEWSIVSILGFLIGWACASLGFGLGQPQIISRYLATKSPTETHQARWIYILYVQVTWVSMTLFGMILRGIEPSIDDPEAGLSVFLTSYMPPILAGIIIADIFGVIASTANSLLVSMALSVKFDILKVKSNRQVVTSVIVACCGLATLIVSLTGSSEVVSLALKSVSFVGAGIASPLIFKLLNKSYSGVSVFTSMIVGSISALMWGFSDYSQFINEAAIGMLIGAIFMLILKPNEEKQLILRTKEYKKTTD